MSEIVLLSNVRLSFPHLIEPQKETTNDGKMRVSYNVDLIMTQDHPGFQNFMKRVSEVASEKWDDNAQNVMRLVQQDRKLRCYGPGEEVVNKKTFQPYSGYDGMMHIGAGCTSYLDGGSSISIAKRPQIIQADGSPIDPANTMAYQQLTRQMYGGCFVNAAIRPWAQDNKHGRAIRCDLVAVQFFKDGEAFGEGATDASSMFGKVEEPAGSDPAATTNLPPFMV